MNDNPARALGIDFGERRIGLALSDPDGRYALPLQTLVRETDRRAIYRIAAIVRTEQVGLLVVGEPRMTDGTESPNLPRVQRFGRRLAQVTGLPLRWVDEALTTREARDRLRAAGVDRRNKRQRLDMVAAQILLQEALDGGGVHEPAPAPNSGNRAESKAPTHHV